MKRTFYISLFVLLAVMLTVSLYYIIIFSTVWNGLIDWRCMDYYLDVTLSPMILSLVSLLGVSIGYRAGKKWWQIIYVDGVYYFNPALKPLETSETPLTPRRRRMQKSVRKTESK